VIDTGGFVAHSDDIFEREIRKQVQIALDEADLLIFVGDTTTGITGQDQDMTNMLRRSTKPVLLVVNKVDNAGRALDASEFYSLGFEKTFFVSSISGSGTGELLDEVASLIPEGLEDDPNEEALQVNTNNPLRLAAKVQGHNIHVFLNGQYITGAQYGVTPNMPWIPFGSAGVRMVLPPSGSTTAAGIDNFEMVATNR
jgi:predicted GTPase